VQEFLMFLGVISGCRLQECQGQVLNSTQL
jgi:hypothetical protein